jgi:hypothetical protein
LLIAVGKAEQQAGDLANNNDLGSTQSKICTILVQQKDMHVQTGCDTTEKVV